MLLWLSHFLSGYFHAFNVFQYLTLRTILATLTSLCIAFIVGPTMIRRLSQYEVGQPIRDDGPQSHLSKAGTPTMGGALILVAVTLSVLICGNLSNRFVWVVLLVTLGNGLVGGVDDYRKLVLKNSKGLSGRWKLVWQTTIALTTAIFIYATTTVAAETQLIFPFLKDIVLPLGLFYLLWAPFVIVGASNAVNLTDGLDGLAIMPTVLVCAALAVFAYVTGHAEFSHYLVIPYVPGVGEVVVFCGAVVGAGLGFLWFNAYPAQVFMGDIGSLALGAALGTIAVVVRQEVVFMIMGGVFVIETLSVIIQVTSFKTRGKRVFKMAPIHHHFELKGWPEPRIIVRFWIITVILVLCGLATLKLR